MTKRIIHLVAIIGLVFVVSQLVAITPVTRPVDYWNMLKADMRPPLSTGVPAKCSFDLDDDGDVDQSDFGVYQTCLGKFTDPQCSKIDLEGDGEIGEIEHVYFRLCETGPNIPADPICQTFLLEGEITKPVGQAVSYAPLRFIGTGVSKGQDFCTKADQWGRWSIRLPAGWTGYYTVTNKIDKYDQRAMGLYQIAVRDAGGE
jgi:hypothetical protein